MAKRFARSLLPDSIREILPDDLTDVQVLLYISAYHRGYEAGAQSHESTDERLDAMVEMLQDGQRQHWEPRVEMETAMGTHDATRPRRQVGQPVDMDALRAEHLRQTQGLTPESGRRTAEPIGPFSAGDVVRVMHWVSTVVKPDNQRAAHDLAMEQMAEWGETMDTLPQYDRLLKALFAKRGLIGDSVQVLQLQDEGE